MRTAAQQALPHIYMQTPFSKSPAEAHDTHMATAPALQHLQPGNTPTTPAVSVWEQPLVLRQVFPAIFQWKLLPGAGLPQHRTQATKSLQEGSDLLISTKSSPMITVLNILMSMNLCCKQNNTLTLLLKHFVFCGQPRPFPQDVNFLRSSFHATRDLKALPTWQRPIRLS